MVIIKFKKSPKDNLLLKKFNSKKLIYYEDLVFNEKFYKINGNKLYKLEIHTYKIYQKKILPKLIFILNDYLKIKYKKKNYEFLIGYWAIHFIQQAYFKYIIVSKILKEHKKCIFLIGKNNNIFCETSFEYFNLILDENYQFHLFSEIVRSLNLNYIEYENISVPKFQIQKKKHFFKVLFSSFYIRFFNPKFIYIDSYFKKNSLFKKIILIIKSKFNIFFYTFDNQNRLFNVNTQFRNKLFNSKKTKIFEKFIINVIIKNLPIEYLEANKYNSKKTFKIKELFNNKIFISSQSLSFNNQFKYYFFHFYKNNKLVYLQHGHGYGMDSSSISERYETYLSDFYLTWGWNNNKKNVIPFFFDLGFNLKIKSSEDIVLVSSVAPKHLHRFQQFPICNNIYKNFIENNSKFLNKITFHNKIYFREYPNSKKYGWNLISNLKLKFKDLIIDNNKNFYRSIFDKKIVIFDHFGTSFIELIQLDKHCILYLDPYSYSFNNKMMKCLKKLVDVKIVFFDPVKAAIHLNKNIKDLDNWWNNRETVSAKNYFINLYCKKSLKYDNEFIKILNNIALQ